MNHLKQKIMDRMKFKPTEAIIEYESKLRECVGQREKLKRELTELEQKTRDIFWDFEHVMLDAGIKYYGTCADYYVCKIENEYIIVEIKRENERINHKIK